MYVMCCCVGVSRGSALHSGLAPRPLYVQLLGEERDSLKTGLSLSLIHFFHLILLLPQLPPVLPPHTDSEVNFEPQILRKKAWGNNTANPCLNTWALIIQQSLCTWH